jgi:fructan beta-fructosidase
MKKYILFVFLLALGTACVKKKEPIVEAVGDTLQKEKYRERYRPAYHFSPAINWTNDPNGLVFYKGEYHLFYQYNPFGNRWGHMSWGHAVTKDLLHWEHLPVAITEYPDKASGDSTMIFSGSAVVDTHNTSGFFAKDSSGLVAIYTSHVHRNNEQITQHQSIAHSADRGRTFTRYENNPVIDAQLKDFRDPKVIWYEAEQKWVMATVIPDQFKVRFYESKNLKEWKQLSEFGPLGDKAKIWECPDLVQVASVDDPAKKKWVLLISNSHPQGPTFVGMQYFIGNFDGKKFTAENPQQYPLYLEYGKDFYAAVTFNNVPASDGRTILLGWANNWAYAQDIPTDPWRSAMTLPRELYLIDTPKGQRIVQKPVRELLTLRGDTLDTSGKMGRTFEVEYEFKKGTATTFGLELTTNTDEKTVIGYDRAKQEVYLDRTKSGNTSFHKDFSSVERAPAQLVDGKLKLHLYVDNSIIEVYINNGEQVITDQIFPTENDFSLKTFQNGGDATVRVHAWKITSTWK